MGKHINTDYAVTGWMIFLIPHIREDVFKNVQNKHHIQLNNVIKTLYTGSTEKELYGALGTFWSKYTNSNQNIDPFGINEFKWNIKYISDSNSHQWNQKYSLPSNIVLGFVVCRVTTKILGTGSADRSWGDVKTIKPGKRSALGSDISNKHSIVYTSACIEETRIGRTLSHPYSNDGSHSHYWNEKDQAFEYQLGLWGLEKLFPNADEAITRELKLYIEEWGKLYINTKS